MSQLRFPKLTEITGYLLVSLVYGERSLKEIFPNLAVIRGKELFLDYSLVIYENDGLQEINLPSLTTILDGGVRIEKNINLCYVKTIRWESIMNSNNSLALGTNNNDCYDTCFGGKCKPPAGHGRSTRQYCWAPGKDAQNADCQPCKCHFWFLVHIFVMTYNFVVVNDYYTITVNLFNGHFCRDRDYLSPGLAHFALHTVTFAFVSFIPLLHEAGLLHETWFVARPVWFVGGKMCNIITVQLVLQQWCKMSNLRSGVLPLLFGRWGEKDAWYIYFARCLPIVQNLDFCLISQKQKILRSPALIGQGTYLTSGVITGFEINFFVQEPAGD